MLKWRTIDICHKDASKDVVEKFIGDLKVVKEDEEMDLSFLNINESIWIIGEKEHRYFKNVYTRVK